MKSVWIKHDEGKAHNTQPASKRRDCQVRALATARGMPYPHAWQLLYSLQGSRQSCAFELVAELNEKPLMMGAVRKLSFPAEKGKKRMTATQFCRKHKTGFFILHMAHHVAAVVNGGLFDTWDSSERCVYEAWEISRG